MLNVEKIHVHYGGIHALKGISVSIPEGKIVTLIGANGAGKSSLLRSIAGLVKTSGGKITYKGTDITGMAPEEVVAKNIVMSPEGRRIFPHLSVRENLMLGAYTRSDKEGIARDIEMVIDLFPRLRERITQKGGTLSGGEQQMLAVGRALMSSPEIILLDEPSLGLAPKLIKEVFDIIRQVNKEGKSVLLVEQNAFAALNISDYAYVLEVGSIVLEGTGQDLIADPEVKKAYLGA
ncbi:MAG: ABC transporter ATP-binding protein [Desulfobacter sp.]|nr:MAG: ABC transporter ATP-binding protein [Desulfobacter sp.]